MLGGGSVLSIFDLHGEGKGIKEISRELGFSRNTVRKYLRAREVPERKPAPRSRRFWILTRRNYSNSSTKASGTAS